MEERMREGRSREKEGQRERKRGKRRAERWRLKERTNSETITSLHQMIAFFSYESQEKLPGEWTMREGRIGDHCATKENTACSPHNLIGSGEFGSQ